MKALSIKQPWAWMIIHSGKDIENRSWHTKHRGRFLVHASKGMTRKGYAEAIHFAIQAGTLMTPWDVPSFEQLERGGIIGSVELVDSLDTSESPWYMGEKAFLLRDPKPLAFMSYKGKLQFFETSWEPTL
jgi:hypothetical protein